MITRLIMVLLSLGSLLSGCGTFNQVNLNEGIHSFQVQDYRHAFIRLKPAAERGQPDAQYAIGYMYYYGQGVVENHEKALEWIKRAAAAGQPDAIEALKRGASKTAQ
jgi:TPR repeat protein